MSPADEKWEVAAEVWAVRRGISSASLLAFLVEFRRCQANTAMATRAQQQIAVRTPRTICNVALVSAAVLSPEELASAEPRGPEVEEGGTETTNQVVAEGFDGKR